MMIGAKDVAFPKLNLLSWYVFMLGGLVTLFAMIRGGVDTGWTFYTPFSTSYSTTYVTAAALGIFISGFSSIMTGLNFIATIHRMRAPGMTWFRLPMFIWSHYATSIILVLATPVLAITLLMVAVERIFQVGIFDPALGGDPVLFQHMFWFYSHPAVYIMVLPGMAVVSEIIPAFSRQAACSAINSWRSASMAIAVLGFLVWGHHMFVAGQSALFGAGVFVPELHGGRALGDQSLQLERHHVQGLGFLGHADAVCHRLHRPVYHRRDDRPVSGGAGNRRPCYRYLLRGRAFSLHHGRRNGHGVIWAEFIIWWPKITGKLYPEGSGEALRADRVPRLQSYFFPAIRSGLSGHAAALCRLSAGISIPERALHGGRVHSGDRLSSAAAAI